MTMLLTVVQLLKTSRFRYSSETELQQGVAELLERHGCAFTREVSLSATDRIDFLSPSGIGIEVKVARRAGVADVQRQLERYARSPKITSLILLTDRSQLARVGPFAGGKSVHVHLVRSGLL